MAQHGDLFLIGGAEDRSETGTIMRQFVQSAGGTVAQIGIITAATEAPAMALRTYFPVFERLGVKRVFRLPCHTRAEADRHWLSRTVEECTGVFFVGGAQHRLLRALNRTRMWNLLMRRHVRDGVALAGTSAGASALGQSMIAFTKQRDNGETSVIQPGLNAISGVIVDQHFSERARLRRLRQATACLPSFIGVGIDEDTAVWVHNDCMRVIGSGHVTRIEGGNIRRFHSGQSLAVSHHTYS